MEVGGAVKNVIALAAGMCEGLGLGTNAMSALVTRGVLTSFCCSSFYLVTCVVHPDRDPRTFPIY